MTPDCDPLAQLESVWAAIHVSATLQVKIGEPKLAARSEATSEYLELMQPVVVLADKQHFSLNETEFAAAERIIADNLEMIKRMSQQNVGRPLRLGMVTLQLDDRQTNLASSMLMALMEAMHTVEGDIMDRWRVMHSSMSNFVTYNGNFYRFQVRPRGYVLGEGDLMPAIELSLGQIRVSLGEIVAGYAVTDDTYRRVIISTSRPLVDAVHELAQKYPEPVIGVVLVRAMTGKQLREIVKAVKTTVPHLLNRAKAPLGDPDMVTAVGTACFAWDLIEHCETYQWSPEEVRHDEL